MGSILQTVITVPLWPRVQSTGKKCGKDSESLNLHLRQWQSRQRVNMQHLGTAALFYIRNHNTGRCEFRGYSSTLKKKKNSSLKKKNFHVMKMKIFLHFFLTSPVLNPPPQSHSYTDGIPSHIVDVNTLSAWVLRNGVLLHCSGTNFHNLYQLWERQAYSNILHFYMYIFTWTFTAYKSLSYKSLKIRSLTGTSPERMPGHFSHVLLFVTL